MEKDHIGYDTVMDNALRNAVREVLVRIAENGLFGNHQLYITFLTDHKGVEIPIYLRDQYPDELTIVLQHQFWDLEVNDADFSVYLSFNKTREQLIIPFDALTGFADPSVKFGLQFQSSKPDSPNNLELVPEPSASQSTAKLEKMANEISSSKNLKIDSDDQIEKGHIKENSESGEKVVELDLFRKK